MDRRDLPSTILRRIVESVSCDSFRCVIRDEFDTLHHPVDDLVLDTRVLALGVFPDQHLSYPASVYNTQRQGEQAHCVDIIIRRLIPLDRNARADVCEEVERPPECEIERDVTLPDRCCEGTFQGDGILLYRVYGVLGDPSLPMFEDGCHVAFFPVYWRLARQTSQ